MKKQIRFLMFIVAMYYFLQAMGGNPGLHSQSLQKLLKESWKFSPSQAAAFFAFLNIPWMIKPVYGLISDFFPIFDSRRKNYFVITGILAVISYGLASWLNISNQALSFFLFAAAVGIAFSDVLCDAIMIEKGKPLGIIDRLQSAQWFALGFAGILIAFSKGYIAEYLPFTSALRLSMIAPLVMVLFTIFVLKEERRVSSPKEALTQAYSGLKEAIRSKSLWAAAIFIFLFQLSPSLGSVLYYYEKDVLSFSDITIGQIDTVGNAGFLAGTVLFGLLAKRMSHKMLLHAIIVTGTFSTLAYLFFDDKISAFAVTAFASIIYVVAFLGILTLAAKACPKYAEATVFAVLMSVSNGGIQLGSIIGSTLYERIGYSWLVVLSAVFTAAMWLFLPLVRKMPENIILNEVEGNRK